MYLIPILSALTMELLCFLRFLNNFLFLMIGPLSLKETGLITRTFFALREGLLFCPLDTLSGDLMLLVRIIFCFQTTYHSF